VAASTSFRISDTAKARLASRAVREGMTATALLDLLIIEGIGQLDYPGIVFRGPAQSAFLQRSRICIPASSGSPWTTRRSTQTRSGSGSTATWRRWTGAARWQGNARRCWRDILPDR